jgi:hypothetical protein
LSSLAALASESGGRVGDPASVSELMSGRDGSTVGQTHPPDLPTFSSGSSWSRQSAVSCRNWEKRNVN